jgi:hypothetical protein
LNIIVGDSDDTFGDGSHNGVAQNYLGNTLKNSNLGLTGAQCIGALSFAPNSVIYWLIASDTADLIVEYNELIDLTTVVLKATKVNPTTPSILNFNKDFVVTGINYINGLLFWTDNYNPPRRINIDRAKNYPINPLTGGSIFTEADINVIVKPPLSAPTINLTTSGDANNLENKFIYFAYRYKYIDNEYSALSPFSPVAFLPKPYAYDYGISENISMVNRHNTATISYNTGSSTVTEIQLIYRDTASLNTYVIDNINKSANGFSNNSIQTFEFKNNKVYTLLPQDQVARLFDNVPLKAKAQELIGSRLIYGNYTQFFDLINSDGSIIFPKFKLELTTTSVPNNIPKPTFKSNRDYEIGIEYLDDYGRASTVIVPLKQDANNFNTIYIPPANAILANNIKVTIAGDYKPPVFATFYRFMIKQDRQEYYNIFPLTYFSDGQFKWFLINQADVDKISVGSYLYLKNSTNSNLNTQFKILDIVSKSANFLNNGKSQPAGVYFRVKISESLLPELYYYKFTNIGKTNFNVLENRFSVAEKAIFYGLGDGTKMTTSNSNIYSGINDIRFKVEISATNKFKYYAFVDGIPYAYVNEVTITPGSNQILSYTYNSITYSCTIQFSSISGLELKDYWIVNCRSLGGKNIFGGKTDYEGDLYNTPFGWVTGTAWNLNNAWVGDRSIESGAIISIKMKEPNNGNTDLIQSFISSKKYVNIEEWFIEDNVYLNWAQYAGALSIGAKNVCFRRIIDYQYLSLDNAYQGDQGTSISATTLNSPVFMWVFGYATGSNPIMEVTFDFQESLAPVLLETVPVDTNQDIYYELSKTYPITNGNHTGNVQNQNTATNVPAIINLNTFDFNSDFNAFSFGNGVESFRIRDDWNAATMQFSPRANSTIEGYEQQTLVQALTYSGVYTQTTAINRLNEFNLSLGNFKYLDRFFGSIQKLHSRDTDIVVFQENKVSKVLYGKNLISDSVGGGTIASIPEVLGTQIAYIGEYGISLNPESFAIWGNDMFFTDARRGAVLRLGDNGLFEISSQGMKNWFKDNLDPSTIKLGMMDPYFEHYVLANNKDRKVNACQFEISNTTITFTEGSGTQSIVITSNNEWYIEVPANDWLTVTPKYGNDKQTITLTATANMGSLRSLILSIFNCSGTDTVTVTQAAHTTTTTSTSTTTTTTAPPVPTTTTTTVPGTYYKLDSCDPLYGTLYTNIVPDVTNQRYIDSVTLVYYVWDNTTTTSPGTIGGNLQKVAGQSGCPGEPPTTTTTTTAAPMSLEVKLCDSSTTYYITVSNQGLTNGLVLKLNNGGVPFDGTQCWEIIDNSTTQPIDYSNVTVDNIFLSCVSCTPGTTTTTTSTTTTTTCAPTTYYELSECAPGVGYAFTAIVPDLGIGQRYVLPSLGTLYTYTGSSISQCDVPPGYNGSIQKTTFTGCDSPTTTTTTTVAPMNLEVMLCGSSTTYYITVSNQGLTNGLAIKLNNGGTPFDGTQCWEIINNATTQPIDYYNVSVTSITLNCSSCS